MKRTLYIFSIITTAVAAVFWVGSQAHGQIRYERIKVKAPFDMPDLMVPVFPDRRFNIADYGALAGNKEATTKAIADAISACHAAGGGRVVVPQGNWITGKIHLKSNVNLHVSEGAELLFSDDPEDYLPAVQSSWEGMECYNYSPLVYAFNCTNVALTGKGTLRAKMDLWETWFGRPEPHLNALKELYHMAARGVPVEQRQMAKGENHFRPQLIQFNRCQNVLIEDIRIRNSPFWTVHLLLSKNVVVRRIDVSAHGHNNDGIDPEMTQNLLVEDCTFDQGDDAIAIKSGRNQDAWRLNMPSRNIVIRNCTIKEGHQMLAIGSEISGGVSNVYAHDCYFPEKERSSLNHLVFIKTNERRGGVVENIFVENITAGTVRRGVLGVATDVLYQWRDLVPTYESRKTAIRNIRLSDIEVREAKHVVIVEGEPGRPVEGVALENVVVKKVLGEPLSVKHVLQLKIDGQDRSLVP